MDHELFAALQTVDVFLREHCATIVSESWRDTPCFVIVPDDHSQRPGRGRSLVGAVRAFLKNNGADARPVPGKK